MWPDLAKFRQFSKNLEIFGNIWKVYLIVGKVVNLLGLFLCFWAKFHHCKWPIIEKTIWPSGHIALHLLLIVVSVLLVFSFSLSLARIIYPSILKCSIIMAWRNFELIGLKQIRMQLNIKNINHLLTLRIIYPSAENIFLSPMSWTNFSTAQQDYPEIKHSDWSQDVTWLVPSNQSVLCQHNIVMLHLNLFMTSAQCQIRFWSNLCTTYY